MKGAPKSARQRGAEWILVGCSVLIGAWALPMVAPIAVMAYGAFKWVWNKEQTQGLFWIAAGIVGLVLFQGFFIGLLWPLKALGALLILAGAGQIWLGSKIGIKQNAIIEIDHKEEP